jgi:hypothetical protein
LPKEEESIKDVVRGTFQTVWFLPPAHSLALSINKPKKQFSRKLSNSGTLNEIKEEMKNEVKSETVKSEAVISTLSPSSRNLNVAISEKIVVQNENKSETEIEINIENENENEMKNENFQISTEYKYHENEQENTVSTTVSTSSTPRSKYSKYEAMEIHLQNTAIQMVDVMCESESGVWAVQLIRETLHGKCEGDELQVFLVFLLQWSLV